MPNRELSIDFRYVPDVFHELVEHLPQSQFVREASCDCHEVRPDWQRNGRGHCLPYAFDKGVQNPRWLVISCMDSRLPPELILGIGAHNICNVRVAGAELGEYDPKVESWRSINLALKHFSTIEGIAFIGHSACGSSSDLISHFNKMGQNDNRTVIEREVDLSYTDDHLQRAKLAVTIANDANNPAEEQGRYLRYNFSHVARTPANAATLLGLSHSQGLLLDHLRYLGKDLPVCTFMINVEPRHSETPLSMLVKQPDNIWMNVIQGQQPDMVGNMALCEREFHAPTGQRVINIVQMN